MLQRTLICYFARVGDLVMLTPLLRRLAEDGPVHLCARPWAAQLLRHESWLAGIHCLASPNIGALHDVLTGSRRNRLGKSLQRTPFDRVIYTDREGQPIRQWAEQWFKGTKVVELPLSSQDPNLHLIDGMNAAAAAIGLPVNDARPLLTLHEADLDAARQRLQTLGRRVIAVQAGSSLTNRWLRKQANLKGLGTEQWSHLITRILGDDEADAVVLMGSTPEGPEARAIRRMIPAGVIHRVHDWTGQVGLADLAAVLRACSAVLSVDTGPAHIAAAVGVPTLVMFGPSNPQRYLPRGSGRVEHLVGSAPCQFCLGTPLFRTCRANVCLTSLDDAAIHAAWKRLLAASAG